MPEITVIVPVYNVESTLKRCLDSILAQTFTDYEVLLIDDGSTDRSLDICNDYATVHSNFRVIHKENEGLGPTRNLGIREAKGKYIYHCDSDDWLDKSLLAETHEKIESENADVVVFGYDIYTAKDGIKHYDSIKIESGVFVGKESVRRLFLNQYYNSFIVLSAWNRLYNRDFIIKNELFFPALRRSQDMAYSLLLFDKIEKLVTINESYYNYIIEPGVFKGRSYREMKDLYYTIYDLSLKQFDKWGLLDQEQKTKLINRYCENIANYSAYAFSIKYRNIWRECAGILLSDPVACGLISQYNSTKGSKFMTLFRFGVKMRKPYFLFVLSELVQRKQSR